MDRSTAGLLGPAKTWIAWALGRTASTGPAVLRKRPLAIVTMVRNEPDFLPIWLHHYERQVGLDDCYILDHASDDSSTQNAGCNVIRLPESPFHEASRSALVSSFCASLLQNYDAVLYTDADEIVMSDPIVAPTLSEYVKNANPPDVVTTIGMDLLHEEGVETPLDPTRSVLSQRRWARASHAGCKPTFIRRPYQWGLGFHFVNGEPIFRGLYNFHIAYADMEIAHRRQAKRNRFLPIGGGAHHAADPTGLMNHIRRDTPWGKRVQVEFGGCPTEAEFTGRLVPFSVQQEPVIWGIPERFRAA